MVVLSLEKYDDLMSRLEYKLDEADQVAEASDVRYISDEVFTKLRKRIDD